MAPIVANITQIIQKVKATSKYFSVINLANCFFVIPLHPDSQDWFAFTIKRQQWTFCHLSQEYHNSLAIAHRHVVNMLDQLSPQERPFVFSYVNDILIFGETKEQTQTLTEKVLALIFKNQRKVRALVKIPASTSAHSLKVLLKEFNFLKPHI